MQCATIKEGIECAFMTTKGCDYHGGGCRPIVEQCELCERSGSFPDGKFCLVFPEPALKWRRGSCNMATHTKADNKNKASKVRVGQQKQRKK